MENRNYEIVRAEGGKQFVGLRIVNNLMEVHIPNSFAISNGEREQKLDILAILNTLKLGNKEYFVTTLGFEKQNPALWAFDSYFWIIRDYLNNGIYTERQKSSVINGAGKINWKQTIQNNDPIIIGKSAVYSKLIVDTYKNENTFISDIYKICLNIAKDRLGWLFGFDKFIDVNESLELCKIKKTVELEYLNTFNLSQRIRFSHMIKILDGVTDDTIKSSFFIFGVKSYDHIFEKMIDKKYGNVTDKNRYYPRTRWILESGDKLNARLEPDTIFKHKDTIYILDAKLYKFGENGLNKNLPDSQAIQKQITYGKYINKICSNMHIRNVFVLPYNKELNSFELTDNLVYFGYALADWNDMLKLQDYEYIIGLFIDMKFLILKWSEKNNDEQQALVNLVESNLNSIKNN
ncbi:MAG: LlaJI family restriction endonuclease [Longicatena sp.]